MRTACLWVLRLSTAALLAAAWLAVLYWMINSFAP